MNIKKLFLFLAFTSFSFFLLQKKNVKSLQKPVENLSSKQNFGQDSFNPLSTSIAQPFEEENAFHKVSESNPKQSHKLKLDIKLDDTSLLQLEGIRFNTSLADLTEAEQSRLIHHLGASQGRVFNCLHKEDCLTEKNQDEIKTYFSTLEALHNMEDLSLQAYRTLLFKASELEFLPKIQESATRIALNSLDTTDLIEYWQNRSVKLSPKSIELLINRTQKADSYTSNQVKHFLAQQFKVNSGRVLSQIQILLDVPNISNSQTTLEEIISNYCELRAKVADLEFRQTLDYNLLKSVRRSGASVSMPRC